MVKLYKNIISIISSVTFVLCIFSLNKYSHAQNHFDYSKKNTFLIKEIEITGSNKIKKNNILNMIELEVGKKIEIPSEVISESIKKLWDQNLFSDVQISLKKLSSDSIILEIKLDELPKLSRFKFEGKISKSDISSLKERLKLVSGSRISENSISTSIKKIKYFFIEKGYYKIKVRSKIVEDSENLNSKILIFKIDKGKNCK